jgi:hypothetical protein
MTDTDDRLNQLCTKCGVGDYQETSIHDDWDGVLHCTNKKCNHEVKRYKSKDNPQPKVEEVKLSPAAQSIVDAYANTIGYYAGFAAVLRAIVLKCEYSDDYGNSFIVRSKDLLAIANELEPPNETH